MNKITKIVSLATCAILVIIAIPVISWLWDHYYTAKFPVFMFSLNADDVNLDYGTQYNTHNLVYGKSVEDVCLAHGAKLISKPKEMPCYEYKGKVGMIFAMKGYRMREFVPTSRMPNYIAEKADPNKVYFYLYHERFHNMMECCGARNYK